METRRVTMAQALLGFLKNQYVERDGGENRFFEGAWGIFGHGIIAGFGQALQQNPDFPYYLCRNEQAAVHIATGVRQGEEAPASAFACTVLDRTRRHQHDHRRRHRHHQPHSGAAAARRHLRPPQRGAGSAAARIATTPRTSPSTTRSNRCRAIGTASTAPTNSPARVLGGHARADLAGADGRRHAGAAAGCADRGLRLSRWRCSKSASGTFRAPGTGTGHAAARGRGRFARPGGR